MLPDDDEYTGSDRDTGIPAPTTDVFELTPKRDPGPDEYDTLRKADLLFLTAHGLPDQRGSINQSDLT